jgi:hypothetical protein
MMLRRLLSVAPVLVLAGAAVACSASPDAEPADVSEADLVKLDPKLEAAALANLRRVAMEVDVNHLNNYGSVPSPSASDFADRVARRFLDAVKREYQSDPVLLKRRAETLASMVFFSAPDVRTDAKLGRVTPFHGMDDAAFQSLMANEDFVFADHMRANGGRPNGVRPFSVCETRFLVEISRGEHDEAWIKDGKILKYEPYSAAFEAFAEGCPQRDKDEWYNFRGLGGLRPSWLESNYMDRVLRFMLKDCASQSPTDPEACAAFAKGRLAYRERQNAGMALRQMVYATDPDAKIGDQSDEAYMTDPDNAGVFVGDRNGDGVAEWIAPGAARLVPGASIKLQDGSTVRVTSNGAGVTRQGGAFVKIASAEVSIESQGEFSGTLELSLALQDGTKSTSRVSPAAVQAVERVDAAWDASLLARGDLGLRHIFADGDGCRGASPKPAECALLKRFYSVIDRHEDFYSTYTSMDPSSSQVSSQPSPLVACSVTLRAAHGWDSAGTPSHGRAGFIYLMRVPFKAILAGDARSIDTLGRRAGDLTSGPRVTTLQSLYEPGGFLDMSKVWLDVATLSNNSFASEHEISKFGSVPAEQIEGILVVRKPKAMD